MEKVYVLKTTQVKDILPFFRKRSNLSRSEILNKLGITPPTLREWEKKPYLIPISSIDILAELYGEDFRDLYMSEKLYNKTE